MDVDTQPLIEKYPLVNEILEEVGTWTVLIEGCPKRVRIKVLKRHDSECPYTGIADHSVKHPDNNAGYRSLGYYFPTVSEALDDAIRGVLRFYDPTLEDLIKFNKEDW